MPKKIAAKANKENAAVDYKELVGFLGEKFEKIDQRFEKIDRRFEIIDQKFEKMDRRFENIEAKLDQKADKSDTNAILDRVVRLSETLDDYRAEQIGMQRQLARHEKWHFKVASKVGVDLSKE